MSRIYTLQDLQARTLSELHVLRGTLQRELALVPAYSADARRIMTSLQTIDMAIRARRPQGPRP